MKTPKSDKEPNTQPASHRSSNALQEVGPFSLSDYIQYSDTETAPVVEQGFVADYPTMPISKAPPNLQQRSNMFRHMMQQPGMIMPWGKNNPLIDIENPARESWRVEDPNDYPFGLYVNPKDLILPPKPPPEEKKPPARRGRPPGSKSPRKGKAAPEDETEVGPSRTGRRRVSSPVKKSTKSTVEPRTNPWRSCRG